MPNIRVNGADLFAVEEGEGDPMVLVHGSLAGHRTWGIHVREFSGRHRVIACSRRYHFPNAHVIHGTNPMAFSQSVATFLQLVILGRTP